VVCCDGEAHWGGQGKMGRAGTETMAGRGSETDGWMDGWMDEWMDGWTDGWKARKASANLFALFGGEAAAPISIRRRWDH